jgi:hypothetical protein
MKQWADGPSMSRSTRSCSNWRCDSLAVLLARALPICTLKAVWLAAAFIRPALAPGGVAQERDEGVLKLLRIAAGGAGGIAEGDGDVEIVADAGRRRRSGLGFGQGSARRR